MSDCWLLFNSLAKFTWISWIYLRIFVITLNDQRVILSVVQSHFSESNFQFLYIPLPFCSSMNARRVCSAKQKEQPECRIFYGRFDSGTNTRTIILSPYFRLWPLNCYVLHLNANETNWEDINGSEEWTALDLLLVKINLYLFKWAEMI